MSVTVKEFYDMLRENGFSNESLSRLQRVLEQTNSNTSDNIKQVFEMVVEKPDEWEAYTPKFTSKWKKPKSFKDVLGCLVKALHTAPVKALWEDQNKYDQILKAHIGYINKVAKSLHTDSKEENNNDETIVIKQFSNKIPEMSIAELLAFFRQEKTQKPNEFNTNIHKPINKYVQNVSNSNTVKITQLYDDIDQLVAVFKQQKLSPYTIRNYLRLLSQALQLDIVKNNFKDSATFDNALNKMTDILKVADAESNNYAEEIERKNDSISDEISIDLNDMESNANYTVVQKFDTSKDTIKALEERVFELTIENTRLLAINKCLEEDIHHHRLLQLMQLKHT